MSTTSTTSTAARSTFNPRGNGYPQHIPKARIKPDTGITNTYVLRLEGTDAKRAVNLGAVETDLVVSGYLFTVEQMAEWRRGEGDE